MGKRLIPIVTEDVQPDDLPGPVKAVRYLKMESPEQTARRVVDAVASAGKSA